MGLGRGAGGHEEESDQGGCGDLHGAAGAEGFASGAGAGAGAGAGGLLGSPLHDARPLRRCPPFIPGRWAGAGFQGNENECIVTGKLCQDRPALLSWRRQGNRRRGSAGRGAATFRFHLGARRGPARAQAPTTPTLPLLQAPHRPRARPGRQARWPEPRWQCQAGGREAPPASSRRGFAFRQPQRRRRVGGLRTCSAAQLRCQGTDTPRKPLPGVKSQLIPSFARNTTSHPAPPVTAGIRS